MLTCHSSKIQNKESVYNDIYKKLDKLTKDFHTKPIHWTDEYWDRICKKYKWFMYKDEYAGCKVCYNIKIFMGKKTLLALMKLFIMNLSYQEFEHKLAVHEAAPQHQKSLDLFLDNFSGVIENSSEHNTIEYLSQVSCPLCGKNFKFKKNLASHIYSCYNTESNRISLNLHCDCEINLYSLRSIDDHCQQCHVNLFSYSCKFCSELLPKTTTLFNHLLINHDFCWNPYLEFPDIVNKSLNQGSNCTVRLSSTSENVLKHQSMKRICEEEFQGINSKSLKVMEDQTNIKSLSSSIQLTSIVICKICEGRYLSQEILDKHISRYHSEIFNNNDNELL